MSKSPLVPTDDPYSPEDLARIRAQMNLLAEFLDRAPTCEPDEGNHYGWPAGWSGPNKDGRSRCFNCSEWCTDSIPCYGCDARVSRAALLVTTMPDWAPYSPKDFEVVGRFLGPKHIEALARINAHIDEQAARIAELEAENRDLVDSNQIWQDVSDRVCEAAGVAYLVRVPARIVELTKGQRDA